jgi:hypothetical protein
MRKSASIILLLVILFNMIGYRVWFYYAEGRADAAIETRIDNNQYDENELVALSIPLYNPYQLEQKSFERVNGEININGKIFKYVKRRVSDGNLILLCIPDNQKNILKKAKSDFENATNDLTSKGKNSGRTSIQKGFSNNEYINQYGSMALWEYGSSNFQYHAFKSINFTDPQIESPGKPPQSLA